MRLEKPDAFDRGRHHEHSSIVGFVVGGKEKESRALGIISHSRTDQYFSVFERHFDFFPGEGLPGLKAIFFVRNFSGDNSYEERKTFVAGKALSGRKIEVTFNDGEVLVGTTTGYDAHRPGFFLFPADDKTNNTRTFVVTAAVKGVRFL